MSSRVHRSTTPSPGPSATTGGRPGPGASRTAPGMRPNVGKRCQAVLSIPMHAGWDSLNVAQAGAMIMGEMLRQHGGGVWPSQG